jgi:DNA-binding MarR family transcriptional regulator
VAVDELATEQDRLGFLLARHGYTVNDRIRRAMAETGLKPRHRQVLVELAQRGPTSQQALIEALGVDPSILVAILNDLERSGLCERRRDPADRRRHIVEMAAKGCSALKQIEEVVSTAEDELFADLDAGEREQLHGLLSRVRTMAPDEAECDKDC